MQARALRCCRQGRRQAATGPQRSSDKVRARSSILRASSFDAGSYAPVPAPGLAAGGPPSAPSNLGELQRIALQGPLPSEEAVNFLQRADPKSFEQAGLYIDGGSIFASSFLLLLLLVFGGNRIGGNKLDDWLFEQARSWKAERDLQRRQALNRLVSGPDDQSSEGPGTPGQGPPSGPS